jgi:hypothetical protein
MEWMQKSIVQCEVTKKKLKASVLNNKAIQVGSFHHLRMCF